MKSKKGLIGCLVILPFLVSFCGKSGGGSNPVTSQNQGTTTASLDCVSAGLFSKSSTQCRVTTKAAASASRSYAWKSSCGGSFSSNAETTTFTAPTVSSETSCTVEAAITDGGSTTTKALTIKVSPGKTIDESKLNIASDSAAASLQVKQVSGDSATLEYTGVGAKPKIEAGEYIVSKQGDGTIKKVTSVSESGNTYQVSTTSASVAEVVESGSGSTQTDFAGAKFRTKFKNVKPISLGSELGADLTGLTLYNDGKLSITIVSGNVKFTPTLDIDASISGFSLSDFSTTVSGDLTLNATVKFAALASFTKEVRQTVAEYQHPFVFFIGPVPVVVVATLKFDVGATFTAKAEGSITVPTTSTVYVKMGAKYSNGSWSSISDKNASFKAGSPAFGLHGDMAAYLFAEPEINLKFYAVAGPFLNAHPYAGVEANADFVKLLAHWQFVAGVYSDVGFEIGIFDKNIVPYSYRLFEYKTILKEGDINLGNQAPTASITSPPSGSSYEDGASITFTANATDPEDGTLTGSSLTWTENNEPIGTGASFTKSSFSVGSHTVVLIATDSGGKSDTASVTFTVTPPTNRSPAASLSAQPSSGASPLAVAFQITCSDPDINCSSYTLDFGDGTAQGTGAISDGATVSVNHTYSTAGNYTAALIVTDSNSATGSATAAVTVTPPVVLTQIDISCDRTSLLEGQTTACKATGIYSDQSTQDLTSTATWASSDQNAGTISANGTFIALSAGTPNLTASQSSVTSSPLTITVEAKAQASVLALGAQHSCSVTTTGAVKCWGSNQYGQLGTGTTTTATTPASVLLNGTASSVASGESHSCAIASGQVYCWGRNSSGQLGDSSFADSTAPVAVSGLNQATQIAVGANHTCALLSSGSVVCWGANSLGQLGNQTFSDSSTPVTVSALPAASQIASGGNHTCARDANGKVYCWGGNSSGELGNGSSTSSNKAVLVSGITSAVDIAAGLAHSCAVLSSGSAKCWGDNSFGELGNSTTSNSTTPTSVSNTTQASRVYAGGSSTCLLSSSGTLSCFGRNDFGQLGDGTTSSASSPVTVTGLSSVQSASVGYYHSCAVLSTNSIRCWGRNSSGQLGDGSTTDATQPQSVTGFIARRFLERLFRFALKIKLKLVHFFFS